MERITLLVLMTPNAAALIIHGDAAARLNIRTLLIAPVAALRPRVIMRST